MGKWADIRPAVGRIAWAVGFFSISRGAFLLSDAAGWIVSGVCLIVVGFLQMWSDDDA